jgi:hypothetical protein
MADNLTTFKCRLSRNLGASTSWNPQCLSRPVMGLLYLYIYRWRSSGACSILKQFQYELHWSCYPHRENGQWHSEHWMLLWYITDSVCTLLLTPPNSKMLIRGTSDSFGRTAFTSLSICPFYAVCRKGLNIPLYLYEKRHGLEWKSWWICSNCSKWPHWAFDRGYLWHLNCLCVEGSHFQPSAPPFMHRCTGSFCSPWLQVNW